MKTKIRNLFSGFCDVDKNISGMENWDTVSYKHTTKLEKYPDSKSFIDSLPIISNRDKWRFAVLSQADEPIIDICNEDGNLGNVYDTSKLNSYVGEEVTLLYSIKKNIQNNKLTIYEYDLFYGFLNDLSLRQFYYAINRILNQYMVFEFYSDSITPFETNSLSVVRHGSIEHKTSAVRDSKKILYCKSNTQWNDLDREILPEDFFTNERTSPLAVLFRKACTIYCAMFVCDNSMLDNSALDLRLCGFKSLHTRINLDKIQNVTVEDALCDKWFKIYEWCYSAGYVPNKLNIARNIISLNCTKESILEINDSTLSAIESNFKIFEQDNVRQYIKVRNEVSQHLLDLQDKINAMVEGFTGEFKKNIVAVFTFFLTLVVVRVVAKGDFLGGFSVPVIQLSFIFILISFVVLIFSRKELSKKEKLYDKHYNQLKERYSFLLSEDEIKKVFEDCDPKKHESHANYIEWQKKVYTWLWGSSLVMLTVFLLWQLFLNTLCLCDILKALLSCFIKNTSV